MAMAITAMPVIANVVIKDMIKKPTPFNIIFNTLSSTFTLMIVRPAEKARLIKIIIIFMRAESLIIAYAFVIFSNLFP